MGPPPPPTTRPSCTALLDVLDRADQAGRRGAGAGCALGSVAANLGDTRGAAGVAALLKASLAMTAATIPPTTGCVEPHELLRDRPATFRLPRIAEEWPGIRAQLAAVNSLGAAATSGTDRSGATHLVLRREQDGHRPGRRRRSPSVRGIARQGSAPRGTATIRRSCPVGHAAPEPERPGHISPPRPWSSQDFQRASQPPSGNQPVPGGQPPPQRSLPSVGTPQARTPQAGTPRAQWAAKDSDLGPTKETHAADEAGAAAVAGVGAGADSEQVRQGPPRQAAALSPQPTAPYVRLQRVLALQSAAIVDRLAMAKTAAAVPGQDPALPRAAPLEPVAATETPARPAALKQPEAGPQPPAQTTDIKCRTGRLSVHEWGSGADAIVALCGRDRADLIARLDEITVRAAALSGSRLREFARDLRTVPASAAPAAAARGTAARGSAPATAGQPSSGRAPEDNARAALVGSDPAELVALASRAAAILRVSTLRPLRSWPERDGTRPPGPGACAGAPGVYLSEGARGRVALVFGGLAWTSAEHVAALSTSAATIAWARRLGVDARVAAAFGLGEIIGLAWAEAITQDEAARLAALRAEILRPMGGLTSMARVHADRETTARLLAGTQLVRAVDEGPAQQVVAGPLPSLRALPHRAAGLGVDVDLLNATCGLHCHEMWPCVPPMAAIAGGTPIGPSGGGSSLRSPVLTSPCPACRLTCWHGSLNSLPCWPAPSHWPARTRTSSCSPCLRQHLPRRRCRAVRSPSSCPRWTPTPTQRLKCSRRFSRRA